MPSYRLFIRFAKYNYHYLSKMIIPLLVGVGVIIMLDVNKFFFFLSYFISNLLNIFKWTVMIIWYLF